MSILYIVVVVLYLQGELIINGNKQELMIIKGLFEGPVGENCIARNTIKCLFESQTIGLLSPFERQTR